MAVNRLDATKPAEEVRNGDKTSAAAPVPAAPSGMKACIPLMVNILLTPVIAYGDSTFVLITKLRGGTTQAVSVTPEAPGGGGEHGAAEANSGKTGVRSKVSAPLGGKVLVNVAGTAGARYLVANIT